MTKIPEKIEPPKMTTTASDIVTICPLNQEAVAINQLIDYLTAREELEDKCYKELTSRIDTITGNPLEMKGGKRCPEEDFGFEPKDQPKRWPQKGDLILRNTFHQELQKAREEERMGILKIALTMGDCPINSPEADAGWMKFQHDFCIKLTKDNKKSILSENDQSELDQPNNNL